MVKVSIASPDSVLSSLDSASIARLLETVSDLSLVIDADGSIAALSVGSEDLRGELEQSWQGRLWADTVVEESRATVAQLTELARAEDGVPVWREVVHRLPDGAELPMRYCVAAVTGSGRLLAIGRDLRALAAMQQQVLNAQLALEQDYWRLRQLETRYQLLFQMTGDAVLVVDEVTGKILEANPTANALLGAAESPVIGKGFPVGFDEAGAAEVRDLLAEARAVGRGQVDNIHLARGDQPVSVTAHMLRQDNETRFLVRLAGEPHDTATGHDGEARLTRLVQGAPDAVVLTDLAGRVLAANQTFVDLAQLSSDEQVVGTSIDRWLGRTMVDANVLLANLRQHEAVKRFATSLRGEYGLATEVEISASQFTENERPLLGFFIRDIGRRVSTEDPNAVRLPKSVEQVTQQVGRMPLKELVRESTDIIEKLCIEAALRLTGGNRASAAELLGLSRQSLYAKLNRYNLTDGSLAG
jgi:transcriptional regulator PpsR